MDFHLYFFQQTAVPWDAFLEKLLDYCQKKELSSSEEKALKLILDPSDSQIILVYKFSEFLKLCGPLSECIDKVVQ